MGKSSKTRAFPSTCLSLKAGVTPLKGIPPLPIQNTSPDLEQEMHSFAAPSHQLLFNHPLADRLVDESNYQEAN